MSYKIVSWNLNSIRIRKDHLRDLISKHDPDVIFLQETRVDNSKYPIIDDYNNYYFGEKGRNGVAILSKHTCDILFISDRKIIAKYNDLVLINIYAPCQYGEEKITFFDSLLSDIDTYENIILGGDFNATHNNKDVHKMFCDIYNDTEREFMHTISNKLVGLSDIGKFTWWDYRVNGFDNNIGLGIDKFFVSPNIKFDGTAKILKYFRGLERPSDHAPILCQIL